MQKLLGQHNGFTWLSCNHLKKKFWVCFAFMPWNQYLSWCQISLRTFIVTVIVGLPHRLTSFWIISPQISSISSNFLSNSPFPPCPAGRLEQLKSPWLRLTNFSSCFESVKEKNTIKAGGSTATKMSTGWMDGYPLDCYDY